MKGYLKDRYIGYGNIVTDICLLSFIVLLCTKLLGASYSYMVVSIPLLLLVILYVLWYLIFVYCMAYQYGGSLVKDMKRNIVKSVKGAWK